MSPPISQSETLVASTWLCARLLQNLPRPVPWLRSNPRPPSSRLVSYLTNQWEQQRRRDSAEHCASGKCHHPSLKGSRAQVSSLQASPGVGQVTAAVPCTRETKAEAVAVVAANPRLSTRHGARASRIFSPTRDLNIGLYKTWIMSVPAPLACCLRPPKRSCAGHLRAQTQAHTKHSSPVCPIDSFASKISRSVLAPFLHENARSLLSSRRSCSSAQHRPPPHHKVSKAWLRRPEKCSSGSIRLQCCRHPPAVGLRHLARKIGAAAGEGSKAGKMVSTRVDKGKQE